jgi:hypothetical protein
MQGAGQVCGYKFRGSRETYKHPLARRPKLHSAFFFIPLFMSLMADFTMVNPEIVWGAVQYDISSTISPVTVLYMRAK